jgi:hypothetical protein
MIEGQFHFAAKIQYDLESDRIYALQIPLHSFAPTPIGSALLEALGRLRL